MFEIYNQPQMGVDKSVAFFSQRFTSFSAFHLGVLLDGTLPTWCFYSADHDLMALFLFAKASKKQFRSV
jgi:hypothetical protein